MGWTHTGNFTALVLIGRVYIFVFGLVSRVHIPIESVFQSGSEVFILDVLKLLLATAQSTSSVDKMRFGFRNEPIGKCVRDLR